MAIIEINLWQIPVPPAVSPSLPSQDHPAIRQCGQWLATAYRQDQQQPSITSNALDANTSNALDANALPFPEDAP
ncbi:hypothetical protein SAMN05660284_01987 [Formivibrio citricus]|uniref:Uncharacterized protein n=1 Tax=Formivibrio citricus TaxID=83765 RepID=A0A1I5ATI0_9NEIS|nr:hypothetical protein [Formivibrio citricus]SFN65734.1 hypothetical protein SAMN05660284_01987 [Formivibrio citricus]